MFFEGIGATMSTASSSNPIDGQRRMKEPEVPYGGREIEITKVPGGGLPEDVKLSWFVDIESLCDDSHGQPLISVGYVVGDVESGKVYEIGRHSLRADKHSENDAIVQRYAAQVRQPSMYMRTRGRFANRHKPYEWFGTYRCIKEFWESDKIGPPKELLELIEDEAVTPELAMERFMSVEDRWHIRSVGTDNPAYDIARINSALKDYVPSRQFDFRYSKSGDYLSVIDPSEQMKGLPKAIREEIYKRTKGAGGGMTHRPDDDAYDIFKMAVLVRRACAYFEEAISSGHPIASEIVDQLEKGPLDSK